MNLTWFLFLLVGANCHSVQPKNNANVKNGDLNKVDNKTKPEKGYRIINGRRAFITSLPHQAQFLQNGIQICGAVIISRSWILTAGHCIKESSPKWSIATGSDIVSQGKIHEISEYFVHSHYDKEAKDSDIALILLAAPIVFSDRQKPIPLASRMPNPGEMMTISGFGTTSSGELGTYLETTNVEVIGQQRCQQMYANNYVITNNMFCAGTGESDSCQGDSGGPGVIDGELFGIVSFGKECASKQYPGIYTNVFVYREWINAVIKSKQIKSKLFQPIPKIQPLFPTKLVRLPPLPHLPPLFGRGNWEIGK